MSPKRTPDDLTESQRKTLEVISHIQQTWVALWFALGLVGVGFIVFILALFFSKDSIAKSISGGIDLVFGWVLRQVYGHLFPSPSNTAGKTESPATLPAAPEHPKLDQ
jgi:hypothetical protein